MIRAACSPDAAATLPAGGTSLSFYEGRGEPPTALPSALDTPPFDISAFPDSIQRRLKIRAAAIHKRLDTRRMIRSARAAVQVGLRLQTVHDLVSRKHFQAWLRAQFCWKQPTATKFMRSAAAFKNVDCL